MIRVSWSHFSLFCWACSFTHFSRLLSASTCPKFSVSKGQKTILEHCLIGKFCIPTFTDLLWNASGVSVHPGSQDTYSHSWNQVQGMAADCWEVGPKFVSTNHWRRWFDSLCNGTCKGAVVLTHNEINLHSKSIITDYSCVLSGASVHHPHMYWWTAVYQCHACSLFVNNPKHVFFHFATWLIETFPKNGVALTFAVRLLAPAGCERFWNCWAAKVLLLKKSLPLALSITQTSARMWLILMSYLRNWKQLSYNPWSKVIQTLGHIQAMG